MGHEHLKLQTFLYTWNQKIPDQQKKVPAHNATGTILIVY
jgi:hypothetical protein